MELRSFLPELMYRLKDVQEAMSSRKQARIKHCSICLGEYLRRFALREPGSSQLLVSHLGLTPLACLPHPCWFSPAPFPTSFAFVRSGLIQLV
ncbi:hypothetical protein Cob_v005682 [Colletotrichum orbiculare MAFF 240422]|uniref:Uncharacterized protein n=1 Tax=Colletotrichum orbiculare (strain 104-T / ATCC 96160 / CBS 514.97 / LARS 414 / MAFF 240422) TaxID=1213857 RepID=A0A484FUI9_COLOR|nr:hypothetical protein Cob_v005682 [Colletotrichum orbiculare MAFF 240422]